MFSLICVWINGWVNNREAGDVRRFRAHYDVTVMTWFIGTGVAGTVDIMSLSSNLVIMIHKHCKVSCVGLGVGG